MQKNELIMFKKLFRTRDIIIIAFSGAIIYLGITDDKFKDKLGDITQSVVTGYFALTIPNKDNE